MFYLVWWLFALKFGDLDSALFDLVYWRLFFCSNTGMNACGFDFCRASDHVGVWLIWVFIEGWDEGFFGRIRSEDWGTEYCKGGFRMLEVVEGFGITFDEEFLDFWACWGFVAGGFSVFSVLLCFILF